jgi:hypothetical protein
MPEPHRSTYTVRRASNYEGFKALEQMLEGVATGRLKAARQRVTDFLCDLCKTRKRSQVAVPSRILGRVVPPFRGRVVLCCDACAREMRARGMP